MFLCVFEKLYSLNNVINWVYLYFIFFCHKQALALIMAGVYIREFKSFLCSIQLAVRIPAIFVIKRAWIECLLTWASPTDSLKNYAMIFFMTIKKWFSQCCENQWIKRTTYFSDSSEFENVVHVFIFTPLGVHFLNT